MQKKPELPLEKLAIPGAQRRPRFDPPATPEAQLQEEPSSPSEEVRTPSPRRETSIGNPIFFGFMATVGVGLALLCYFIFMNVGSLPAWITAALFIALGLEPLVNKLEGYGFPRPLGIVTVVSVIAVTLVVICMWAVPKIANQAVNFVNTLPQQFDEFLNSELVVRLDEQFKIRHWVEEQVSTILAALSQDSNTVSSFMTYLGNAGSTIAQVITGTLIVLFLSLYFLSSMPLLKAWLVRLAPASNREKTAFLTEKITGAVGQYVMGQALVAILNAGVAFLLMLIANAPFPQLLTLAVVFLAFIPLIGGVSAGVLVSLVCLTESWETALTFAIGYFIYLQVEAYFVSPRIMSKAVAVPGGIAVIAVAAGGTLWGVLGALIAIPVAASLLIIVQEILVPRQDRS